MQYCVVRVRLDGDGGVAGVEWGPLDGHPLVLVADVQQDGPEAVMQQLRRGKLVWASTATPFGRAPGRLLRIGRDAAGAECLDLAPGGSRPSSLSDMDRF